jgi:sugar phosphate isomerase/epimerase/acetyl esterase/lipase
MNKLILALILIFISADCLSAQVNRERDIIYQRLEGVALTMDVFVPENPNGIGIIKIVSGGWKSRHSKVKNNEFGKPYTDQGYTVFAVFHGSQPRYQVREIMGFMHRAVRFIRTNADRWKIDPDRIGVTGASAGGHLSLVLATKGGPGDPKAKDPVDRASSAVQAAAVFYPPTDYLNWSEAGDDCVGVGKQERWQPAFGDESKTAEGRQTLGRHMSSLYHISEKTPPVSIIHGDADPIVPLFQSESFKKVAQSKGVPIELVIKEGAKHGWPNRQDDEVQFLKWFDQHLLNVKNDDSERNDSEMSNSAMSNSAMSNSATIDNENVGYKIGTCDWSIQKQFSKESFQYGQSVGLSGIQYSFGAKEDGLDLRIAENRDAIRAVVRETGVGISSLGLGILNKVPLASTDEGEQLVVECIEAMATLKEEAAKLEDRELAAKVAPNIVLLAFFGKGDINGKPDLIERVIAKLKRVAPAAEKHGITLAIESLLNESDLRHIMKQVGSPAVKVYYDTGNSARMGYDIYEEIESLGVENIAEIHLKENKALLGKGPIDFSRVRSLLKKMNYKGWLIIEGSNPKGMDRLKATKINAAYSLELFNKR